MSNASHYLRLFLAAQQVHDWMADEDVDNMRDGPKQAIQQLIKVVREQFEEAIK